VRNDSLHRRFVLFRATAVPYLRGSVTAKRACSCEFLKKNNFAPETLTFLPSRKRARISFDDVTRSLLGNKKGDSPWLLSINSVNTAFSRPQR
jgi:hypothetical protein